MSSIKIRDKIFPCTNTPEVPYLRFHKNNIYYTNLDPDEYINGNYKPLNNDNIIPQVYNVRYQYTTSNSYYTQDDPSLHYPQTYSKDLKDYLYYNIDNVNNFFNPKEVTINNINLVELPILYYKHSTNEWALSNKPKEGFHVHPAFMYNGKPHKIRIAKDITTGNFNEIINNLNATENKGFHIYNIYEHSLLYIMMAVTYPESMRNKVLYFPKEKVTNEKDVDNVSFLGIDHILGQITYSFRQVQSYKDIYIYGVEFIKDVSTNKYNIHILKNDGSGEIINTGIQYSSPGTANNKFCQNLISNYGDGYDFRDVMLLDTSYREKIKNPFGEGILWYYTDSDYERSGLLCMHHQILPSATVSGGLCYRPINLDDLTSTDFRIAQYV